MASSPFLGMEEQVQSAVESFGSQILGQRIRRARLRQGISIRELAKRAKLSATSVVRLERGLPFLPITLAKVCEGLGLHLERFLEAAEDGETARAHRHADDQWFDMDRTTEAPLRNGASPTERERVASAEGVTPLLLFKTHLENGSAYASEIEVYAETAPRSHPGEEFVYVLEGRARIQVGETVHILDQGECMSFWPMERHTYGPEPTSRLPVRLLCVLVAGGESKS